jgi:spoIIIJ-associated protein
MNAAPLKELVTSLISALGVSVEKIEVLEGRRTIVLIAAPQAKELIGPNGDSIRALNTIARRLVETKYGEEASNFLIDVNGYFEDKMEVVRQNARVLAQRVRLFKHDVEMSPMSSYERLVVHELFSEDPDIQTESQGEGKFRHIVLKYKQSSRTTA